MDKQNVENTNNGILFNLKKKRILTHAIPWMRLEDIMLSEISQSQENSTVPFHFYEVPTVVTFIERE